MITIGDRMELMASVVLEGESVGDIGTDHGLLPLKLWLSKNLNKAIMSDMSKPSLEKAEDNFKFAFSKTGIDFKTLCDNGKISFRVGDGLKVYEKYEVDNIIIAGMGGRLIAKILDEDLEKSWTFSKYILQPRNGTHILRQFLLRNGFDVVEECLVEEGKYICEIIVAVPKRKDIVCQYTIDVNSGNDVDSVLWELPITEKIINNELLDEFINRKIQKKEKAICGLKVSGGENKEKEIEKLKKAIETFQNRRRQM